eukprot:TRINITY_DN35174_c0_g1_i1.p1 TRINITY_DN35174_c0_g1~~TRINITY_DN35174_c0_g1_i1.p1  ORF type:complete len:499 (+),score=134.45 TRINITY_DN35174_c0_g1_i1:82-1578(+)
MGAALPSLCCGRSGAPLPLPRSGADVTPQWVSALLGGGADVRSVAAEPLGADGSAREDGGGNSGCRLLRLRLEGAGGAEPPLPGGAASCVLKWSDAQVAPGQPFGLRLVERGTLGIRRGDFLRCEHYALTAVRPDAVAAGLRCVGCYAAILHPPASDAAGAEPGVLCAVACDARPALRQVALLEDLTALQRFPPLTPCPALHVAAVARNVAALHRASWGLRGRWGEHAAALRQWHPSSGGTVSWNHAVFFALRGSPSWTQKEEFAELKSCAAELRQRWALPKGGGPAALPEALRGALGELSRAVNDESVAAAIDAARSQWGDLLPQLGGRDAQCIVHGDLHHWNNHFEEKEAAPVAVLMDWQFCGPGRAAHELAYLLISSTSADAPEGDEETLRAYHGELVSGGGAAATEYGGDAGLSKLKREVALAVVDYAVGQAVGLSRDVGLPPLCGLRVAADSVAGISASTGEKMGDAVRCILVCAARGLLRLPGALQEASRQG